MFKVAAERRTTVPVVVQFPSEDGKGWASGQLSATYRFLAKDELNEAVEDERENGIAARDFLDRVLVSVSGVADANNKELSPEEALAAVKADTFARQALTEKYWELAKGKPKK